MSTECRCIYRAHEHPECQRGNATHLVALSNRVSAEMCTWCATDWARRHPDIEILEVGQ